jgi:hypothetical protein
VSNKNLLSEPEPDDYDKAIEVFGQLLEQNNVFARHLFGWVEYNSTKHRLRLKLLHDIELENGQIIKAQYPNSNFIGDYKDDQIRRIRISKKQMGYEWKDLGEQNK